jgi:hypothetical protein
MRFCIVLFVMSTIPLACSSNTAKKTVHPTPNGTDTSTDTNTHTGTDAGESDAGSNENCAVWPAQKLMPAIGPFFFGTNPRPCRVKNVLNNTNQYYQYEADRLISSTAVISGDQTTYHYDGALIVAATRTQASTTSSITYDYTAERLTQSTETAGAVSKTIYQLDSMGYPTIATVEPPQEGQPVRFVHEYENCRLVRRLAYNADGAINDDLSAEYYYDDNSGRITERYATKDDQVYGYLDDSGTCVMP